MLDEKALPDKSRMSYDEWLEYAAIKLPNAIQNYPTMDKMIDTLTEDRSRPARELLATRFLPASVACTLGLPELRLGRFLAAEGALLPVDSNTFKISSPLVHTLLLDKVVAYDRRKPPRAPAPYGPAEDINIPLLIAGSLPAFNSQLIARAPGLSFKNGKGPGISSIRVPSEATYHSELYAILRSWLDPITQLFSEVNAPLKQSNKGPGDDPRCDIVITSAQHCYALEITASNDKRGLLDHVSSLRGYKTALKAEEAWLIHFTRSKEPPMLSSKERGDIHLITISHDPFWTKATLTVDEGGPQQLTCKE